MAQDNTWLQTNGASLAAALDANRDAICDVLTARLAAAFPTICYNPNRADGQAFQQQTLRRTPRRIHALIQTALRMKSLGVIERQYRWAWPLVQRFGVNRQHIIAQTYWYFEVARGIARLDEGDRAALNALEIAVLQIVERSTTTNDGAIRSLNGRRNGRSAPHP